MAFRPLKRPRPPYIVLCACHELPSAFSSIRSIGLEHWSVAITSSVVNDVGNLFFMFFVVCEGCRKLIQFVICFISASQLADGPNLRTYQNGRRQYSHCRATHSPPEFRDEEGTRTIIWWVGLLQLTIGLIHNISIIVAQQVIRWAFNRIIMYMVL
jgi:hypothetical protein